MTRRALHDEDEDVAPAAPLAAHVRAASPPRFDATANAKGFTPAVTLKASNVRRTNFGKLKSRPISTGSPVMFVVGPTVYEGRIVNEVDDFWIVAATRTNGHGVHLKVPKTQVKPAVVELEASDSRSMTNTSKRSRSVA